MKVKYKFLDILKLYFGDYLPLVGVQAIFWVIGDLFDSKGHIEIKDIRALIVAFIPALFFLTVTVFLLCNFTPLRDKSSPEILHKDSFHCLALVFAFYAFSKLFIIDICNELSWNYKLVTAIVMFIWAIISGLLYTAFSGYIKRQRLKRINEKLNEISKE